MALRAVEASSLPDQVFGQLLGEIVSGGYATGATLPSERALSDAFAVNRHVVREALKRLEQVGLVQTTHGGGTRVLDFCRSGGLDLLALIAEHVEVFSERLALLRSGLEMRAGIGRDVARLCALRADARLGSELVEIANRLAAPARGGELLALDQQFWQQMLAGADNLAYQLAFNSLIRAVQAIPQFSAGWLEQELERSDYRRPIAAAIAAADPDGAAATAYAALAPPPATEQPVQSVAGARP